VALHRLTTITIGVPDVAAAAAYYEEFGLAPKGDTRFATLDGGEQLHLVPSRRRRLIELGIGVDDADDLGRVAAGLGRLDVAVERTPAALTATDPGTGVRVLVQAAERIRQTAAPPSNMNGPGRANRLVPAARPAPSRRSERRTAGSTGPRGTGAPPHAASSCGWSRQPPGRPRGAIAFLPELPQAPETPSGRCYFPAAAR